METVAMDLRQLARSFDDAARNGAIQDEPEGARYVQISDTAMTIIADGLRGIAATIDSDPGDEDPTEAQDREIVESETQGRRQRLFELAHQCDTDAIREDAIKSLGDVIDQHTPKPEPWIKRL